MKIGIVMLFQTFFHLLNVRYFEECWLPNSLSILLNRLHIVSVEMTL